MKKVVNLLVMIVMAAGLVAPALAQDPGPRNGGPRAGQGGGRGGMMKAQEEMLAKLNLTDAQKSAVKALNAKTAEALKGLQSKPEGQRREAMQGVMKAHQDGLKKILTPAQWEQLQKMRKEMAEKRKKEGGNKRPGGGGGRG